MPHHYEVALDITTFGALPLLETLPDRCCQVECNVEPYSYVLYGKKFEPVLQAVLAEGRLTAELRAGLDDQVVKLAHLYEEVSIIRVAALMVLKPF